MKTTFKFAGLSALLFGQSLCLLAQTAWHNPAADSLLPIQGRAWNAETVLYHSAAYLIFTSFYVGDISRVSYSLRCLNRYFVFSLSG